MDLLLLPLLMSWDNLASPSLGWRSGSAIRDLLLVSLLLSLDLDVDGTTLLDHLLVGGMLTDHRPDASAPFSSSSSSSLMECERVILGLAVPLRNRLKRRIFAPLSFQLFSRPAIR
jgi:hypothetical protein